ncbi:MAG: inorganic phosphate transporter [Acidobacteriota bacterium]
MQVPTLLVVVIVTALVFDFINGFHDTANAIATVVSTGVLRARTAVLLAAVLNVAGAFAGTAVATTVGKDLLDPKIVTQHLVLSALVGAIVWNLITWWFGLPSSSSHALVGGLCGAALFASGSGAIQPTGLEKILIALIFSPFFGFAAALITMVGTFWVTRHVRPATINSVFRKLQLASASFMAFSHGTNDAQKTMGVITMALVQFGGTYQAGGKFQVPPWVVLACAVAMGLGTACGGWRIIHTMGQKIFKLRPIHGFCAETSAAAVLQVAAHLGLPTSTTHCITAAIMGAGATTRLSAVSWGVTRNILWAWVLTIPMSALVAAVCYACLSAVGLR